MLVKKMGNREKNIFLIYVVTILTGVLSYFVRILFAHNLTLEEYGLFYAVFGLVFFFMPFRDLGLTEAMLFYVNKYLVKKDKSRIKEVVLISLIPQIITGFLFATVFILLSNFLAIHYFKIMIARQVLIVVAVLFSFHTLLPTVTNLFNALHDFLTTKIANLISTSLILISSLLFFLFFPSYIVPALSYLTGISLTIIVMYVLLFKRYDFFVKERIRIEKSMVKKMFKYAVFVLFSSGGALILTYSDIILLTLIRGVSAVGLYNIAWPCLNVILLLITPINNILFPVISRKYHSRDYKGIRNVLSLLYNNLLLFTLPLGLVFFVFSPLIIKVLFGSKYLGATNTLRAFSLFFVFMALRNLNFSVIAGIGKPKERSIIMYYGAGFNVIMDLLLIPKFGATGAALATGLGFALMSYLTYRLIQKHYPVRVDWFLQLRVIIASLLFAVIIHWLKSVLNLNWILESIIVLSLSGIVYLLLLFLFRVLTKERFLMFKKLVFDY